jgi:hypothetical protein
MELLTNTIQVCGRAVVNGALVLSRVDAGCNWHLGAVDLLVGDVWVGELVVDGLDGLLDPLGSASLAFFARDKGVSLLGCVPEEGLDSVLGKACVSAAVYYQHQCLDRTTEAMDVPGHVEVLEKG